MSTLATTEVRMMAMYAREMDTARRTPSSDALVLIFTSCLLIKCIALFNFASPQSKNGANEMTEAPTIFLTNLCYGPNSAGNAIGLKSRSYLFLPKMKTMEIPCWCGDTGAGMETL